MSLLFYCHCEPRKTSMLIGFLLLGNPVLRGVTMGETHTFGNKADNNSPKENLISIRLNSIVLMVISNFEASFFLLMFSPASIFEHYFLFSFFPIRFPSIKSFFQFPLLLFLHRRFPFLFVLLSGRPPGFVFPNTFCFLRDSPLLPPGHHVTNGDWRKD